MLRAARRMVYGALAAAAAGQLLGITSCIPSWGDVGAFVRDFNPCGTILNCDPVAYRFLTSGYKGPGVDPDIDPACTYPPFCADDPFVGGVGP